MNWASYLLSLCLHLAVFLLIMFWPSSPPVNLETPPVMISLVDGAPGGNRTPSSILGKMGKPTDGPKDVSPPAKKADAAAPERPEVKADPTADKARPVEAKPEPKVERKPDPKHEVKPKPEPKDATPVAEKKEKKKRTIYADRYDCKRPGHFGRRCGRHAAQAGGRQIFRVFG